ncbi:MHS family proline/betaine transporter-like MFS transporter [Murinocardiopsis flavida]|uniref:Putative proline/betaine transporter n=1 Tax=Murinocardiopsis flavida TaxID=645275 RepID=A0A2P8DMM0_9ACTN|nr:MHS family proline/betaine transporter-like MFS transporter [Murinocardiopsis flavida]
MGNAVEWFDFAIYGYLAVTIGKLFFPEASPSAQLISTFGIFAASFLIRPLGSIVLGPLGDKWGRKSVLALTIIMMSGATLMIGLIPSYETIGVGAPILLIIARLAQGFSTGGEYSGAATFMAEYVPNRKRGFLGSFLEFGTYVGYTLGSGLVLILTLTLSTPQLESWGWRIPFLIAAPLGLVGVYLRSRLSDTPEFTEAEARGETRTPFMETLVSAWRRLLILVGIVVLLNVGYYILLTYMPTYLTEVLKLGHVESQLATIGIYIGMMIFIAPVGMLSDKFGRKPMLMTSCIGFFVLSVPAFMLMNSHNTVLMVIGLAAMAALLLPLAATIPATLPALFPTRIRFGAFSIGYNVSTALFGGTAPLIVITLINTTGISLIPGFYLMAAAAIAFVPILLMPETANISMRDAGTDREDDSTPDRPSAV